MKIRKWMNEWWMNEMPRHRSPSPSPARHRSRRNASRSPMSNRWEADGARTGKCEKFVLPLSELTYTLVLNWCRMLMAIWLEISVPDPLIFLCGSGSADPCLWLMDPDPAIFVIDLQDANKTITFKKRRFSAYYFLKVHLYNFSKITIHYCRKQGFAYYFCLMIEGW